MEYGTALLVTTLVEVVLVLLLVRRPAALAAALAVNALTHPLAAALLARQALPLEGIEALVVAAEAAGYRIALGGGWRGALGLAAAANGVTWGLSYLV